MTFLHCPHNEAEPRGKSAQGKRKTFEASLGSHAFPFRTGTNQTVSSLNPDQPNRRALQQVQPVACQAPPSRDPVACKQTQPACHRLPPHPRPSHHTIPERRRPRPHPAATAGRAPGVARARTAETTAAALAAAESRKTSRQRERGEILEVVVTEEVRRRTERLN